MPYFLQTYGDKNIKLVGTLISTTDISMPIGPLIYLDPSTYTSGTWNDQSGNGLNVTLSGISYSGANGGVMYIDGFPNSYGFTSTSTLFNNNTTGYTAICWFKHNNLFHNQMVYLAMDDGGVVAGRRSWLLELNYPTGSLYGQLNYTTGTTSGVTYVTPTGGTIANNTWYMMTLDVNYVTGVVTTYIDDIAVSTSSIQPNSKSNSGTNSPLWIGAGYQVYSTTKIRGWYGHIFYYNRALTSAEVSNIYSLTKTKYGK